MSELFQIFTNSGIFARVDDERFWLYAAVGSEY